jgi:hypothetical protein
VLLANAGLNHFLCSPSGSNTSRWALPEARHFDFLQKTLLNALAGPLGN